MVHLIVNKCREGGRKYEADRQKNRKRERNRKGERKYIKKFLKNGWKTCQEIQIENIRKGERLD